MESTTHLQIPFQIRDLEMEFGVPEFLEWAEIVIKGRI